MTDEDSTLSRLHTDLMSRIGIALVQIQVTEKALKLVTTFVLQRSSSPTAEGLLNQMESERRKTMGYFLVELRKRANLDQHFDSTLAEFLNRRNTLVHNLSDLPGWDTGTLRGIYVGRKFINELIEMNHEVLKVFAGLIRAWQIQTGDKFGTVPNHEIFKQIEEKYVPLVDNIFSAKED